MQKKIEIFLIFLALIKYISLKEALVFAFQFFKHGASAPISGVKNGVDLFNENWLKNGEISNVGKRQHYLLGVKARERYIKQYEFLNEIYNPNEMFIKSTDINRTIESAYSFAQGLYPVNKGQTMKRVNINKKYIWYPPNIKYYEQFDNILSKYSLNGSNSSLPYQMNIIPIHIFYIPDIEIQLYDSKICKGLESEYKALNKKKDIKEFASKIMNNNEKTFINLEKKYTSKKSVNKNFMEDYNTLSRYTDNIICDNIDQRNYSSFNNEFPENSLNFTNLFNYSKSFHMHDYYINNYHTNRSKVEGSLTFRSVAYWMSTAQYYFNFTKSNKNGKRYFRYIVYSVDENTFGGFEGLANEMFNTSIEYAEFAESRALELFYDTYKKEYYVRYIKGDNVIKKQMTYSYFRYLVYNKTWTYWNVSNYCEMESIKNYNINLLGASAMIILSVIDGVLIVLLVLFCSRKK